MRRLEAKILPRWKAAEETSERKFPHEFLYESLLSGELEEFYQVDPASSWMLAAAQKSLPLFVPGWEDSTMGNMFAGEVILGKMENAQTVKSGIEYMVELARWYEETTPKSPLGFFQIAGGIAGDFPICVVPMLEQDVKRTDVRKWAYFCQVSDSTTSYGSYSGAVPNEKITWGKLDVDTPSYVIESDATIVAPLIFAHVLGW
jgi:deoxyhypusine synthase